MRVLMRLCTVGWLIALAPAALADTCSGREISAGGEPASYRWLALMKAKGNWRTRVRSEPNLGPDFANWSRAKNPVEKCISSPNSVVCTVIAIPCKA